MLPKSQQWRGGSTTIIHDYDEQKPSLNPTSSDNRSDSVICFIHISIILKTYKAMAC